MILNKIIRGKAKIVNEKVLIHRASSFFVLTVRWTRVPKMCDYN